MCGHWLHDWRILPQFTLPRQEAGIPILTSYMRHLPLHPPDGMMESSLHQRDWHEMSHLPTKPCSPYLLSIGTASLKSGVTPLWKSSNSLGLLYAYLDWHTRLPRTLKGTLETVYSLINGPGERGAGEGEALWKVLEACKIHLDIFVTAILIINYTITYTLKTNLVPGRLKGTEQIQSSVRSFST